MKPTLVVMAAGAASRYGGLKQTEPVGPCGEIIIDYSIFDALHAGFGRIVFVIRQAIEPAFRAAIGDRFAGRIPVDYVRQELDALPPGFSPPAGRIKPWGTAHAVLICEAVVAEPFAIINADDFYGRSSFELIAAHLRQRTSDDEHAIVGYPLAGTLSPHGPVSRAVCRTDATGFLNKLIETHGIVARAGAPDTLVSMNMMGFTPSIFPRLRHRFREFLKSQGDSLDAEFLIPASVNSLVSDREARVRVLRTDSTWFGMTFREDRAAVQTGIRSLVDEGIYPSPLWGA